MVSIIIPTYNATENLIRAIESALRQTYTNIEIIVVDDNNPDSHGRELTEKMMKNYSNVPNVFYYQHDKNKNGSAARNTGLKFAKGDFICFLDDDDEYLPTKIEQCVGVLLNDFDYDAVYSNILMCRNNKVTIFFKAKSEGLIWKDLLLDEGLMGSGSNIFIRREVIEDIGGFDEEFIRYQDVEFMLRVTRSHKIKSLDKYLIKKHLSDRNVPNYRKLKENKERVFLKFQSMILELTKEEQHNFYSKQYKLLFDVALLGKKKSEIEEAKHDLLIYRK